ncbi:MAG TPA: hypothetical protein VNT26_05115, partial [Candidatus Sulfotelmatobacter sp.]|nr:hypothetical protein [Candidatus Sulfotelmatobacter sp.]
LENLDLLGQVRVTQASRGVLEYLLQPKWFRTPAVLGHAKLFFQDFQPAARKEPAALAAFKFEEPKLREYVCYLLLDFVTADPALEETPLAAALEVSGQLGLSTEFEKLATKELKLKARDLKRIKEQAPELLAKAEVSNE